jgi:hypothetical protein
MRRIWAATPNSAPSSSTRTTVAWQHTQHFSPDVSSGGNMSTNSTSLPCSILELLYKKMPLALTSRVCAGTSPPWAVRTRVGTRVTILVPLRRS